MGPTLNLGFLYYAYHCHGLVELRISARFRNYMSASVKSAEVAAAQRCRCVRLHMHLKRRAQRQRNNMEGLPDDVACKVLSCLTDTRSLAHCALASRRCNNMVARADLVRNISVGLPRPVDLLLPTGFKHCMLCFMCKGIIPVPTDPGVVYHQCPHHNYKHPVWSDVAVILYRGPTDHLPQPTPYPAENMKLNCHRAPLPVFQPPQPAPLFA